jgi:uncharacterized membrane protein
MVFSISQIKKKSLASLKGKWGKGVLLTLAIFLVTAIVPLIAEVIVSGGFWAWAEQEENTAAANLMNLFFSFLFIPLSAASYWFYLVIARWNDPKISQVFAVYREWELSLKVVGTAILVGIFIIADHSRHYQRHCVLAGILLAKRLSRILSTGSNQRKQE